MKKTCYVINEERRKLYLKEGFWGRATMLDYWELSVKSFGEKEFVVDDQGMRMTFKALDEQSDCLAAYLKDTCQIYPGDVVCAQLPNWGEFAIILVACIKIGAVFCPLLTGLKKADLQFRISKCDCKVLFVYSQHAELAREVADGEECLERVIVVDKHQDCKKGDETTACLSEIMTKAVSLGYEDRFRGSADDVAIILFTSGTESVGKGVMLTHNNLIANMKGYAASTNINSIDIMCMPVTLAHAQGLMYGLIIPFMMGIRVVWMERYTVERCLEMVARERCTLIQGPTVIAYDVIRCLQEQPDIDSSSLRYFYCGGSPVPRTLVEIALKRNIRILGVYGATESAPHCIVSPDFPIEKVLTTDGRPIPGTEIKVVGPDGNIIPPWTEGEEYSRGPTVFVGYIDEPEMTKASLDDDGWYHSGDLAIMDDDGFIRITGRKKDIIIRGGENISSVEIENVILKHENVKETAVVAYPDERMGEKVCAYIVLIDPSEGMDVSKLQAHMKQHHVAKYKWPERVEIVEQFPRTQSGKIQKFRLRAELKQKVRCETRKKIFN